MIIVLSQKIDTESTYVGDEIFKVYHYPGRYRNQIHTGDTFVYYQGNRYDKSQRYYFGTGKIGHIYQVGVDGYYAELENVIRFNKIVPIYMPDNGYIEQLGYESVRNSPPWRSSIRPLSNQAYDYIISHSGNSNAIAKYDYELKKAVQKYYIDKDLSALNEISSIVRELIALHGA